MIFDSLFFNCNLDSIYNNNNFHIMKNLSVEKEMLSTVPGFEPRSFDCRPTALTN